MLMILGCASCLCKIVCPSIFFEEQTNWSSFNSLKMSPLLSPRASRSLLLNWAHQNWSQCITCLYVPWLGPKYGTDTIAVTWKTRQLCFKSWDQSADASPFKQYWKQNVVKIIAIGPSRHCIYHDMLSYCPVALSTRTCRKIILCNMYVCVNKY